METVKCNLFIQSRLWTILFSLPFLFLCSTQVRVHGGEKKWKLCSGALWLSLADFLFSLPFYFIWFISLALLVGWMVMYRRIVGFMLWFFSFHSPLARSFPSSIRSLMYVPAHNLLFLFHISSQSPFLEGKSSNYTLLYRSLHSICFFFFTRFVCVLTFVFLGQSANKTNIINYMTMSFSAVNLKNDFICPKFMLHKINTLCEAQRK